MVSQNVRDFFDGKSLEDVVAIGNAGVKDFDFTLTLAVVTGDDRLFDSAAAKMLALRWVFDWLNETGETVAATALENAVVAVLTGQENNPA